LSLPIFCLLVGTPLTVAWAIFWPYATDVPEISSSDKRLPPPIASEQLEETSVSLAQFDAFWKRPLRRPLYDPPPKPKPKPKPRPVRVRRTPPPNVLLLGTIVETGHSKAIVQVNGGKMELKGVGDFVGPKGSTIQVERVEPELLVLRRHKDLFSIPIQKKKGR